MASKFNSAQSSVSNNQKATDIDQEPPGGRTSTDSGYGVNRSSVRIPPVLPSSYLPQALPSNHLPYNTQQIYTRNVMAQNVPPPLPPRPGGQMSRFSNYNQYGMGNMYGSFPRYGSGVFSPSYGGYRTGYNRYGTPYHDGTMENNSFIQMAEESTRPAFQSIETIVEAVGSISMMLESTYHAVHSSYSAILGVVDQFSRLRERLAEMLSILALLRGLQWLCLKVLHLLGLRKSDPSTEAAWSAASDAANSFASFETTTKQSAWPICIFIGLVFGAPWLMFRLFSNKVAKKTFDPNLWLTSNGMHHTASAMFDFTAGQPGELSIRAGQKLILAPKNLQSKIRGWILASQDFKTSGLVPVNYLSKFKDVFPQTSTHSPEQNLVVTPETKSISSEDNIVQ